MCVCVCVLPLLSQESDVEFVPLQLFAGVRHHLVEGSLQQVFSPDQQPAPTSTAHTSHTENCPHEAGHDFRKDSPPESLHSV